MQVFVFSKIEGRARGPEYVRTVVECYKEAIRSYLDDTFTDEKIARWDELFEGRSSIVVSGTATTWDNAWANGPRTTALAATERKIYVGKGIRYFSNIGCGQSSW